jgi:hypothetical protein
MRERAKVDGRTFDEDEECVLWQAKGIDLGGLFSKVVTKKDRSRVSASSSYDETNTSVVPQHSVPKTVPNPVV